MTLTEVEREKYETVWQYKEYKESASEGLRYVDAFFELCDPAPRDSVIDIGCGEGKAGLLLAERGLDVRWMDIQDAALDPEVPRRKFMRSALWENFHGANYGYCCEVLEHIPPEYVMLSIYQILRNTKMAFITLCNRLDAAGPVMLGLPLHLTVRPFQWWRDQFEEVGVIHDARDLCGQSLFVVSA